MLNVQGDCKVVKRRVCNGEVHKVRDDGTKITCDQVQWINISSTIFNTMYKISVLQCIV